MGRDGVLLPENPYIKIRLQDGPIRECGVNGCQIDDVLQWTLDVLRQFNASHPCRENSLVITKLEEAQHWLNHRTRDRTARDVEGTDAT